MDNVQVEAAKHSTIKHISVPKMKRAEILAIFGLVIDNQSNTVIKSSK